jgi:hypothetical protein
MVDDREIRRRDSNRPGAKLALTSAQAQGRSEAEIVELYWRSFRAINLEPEIAAPG